MHLRNGWETKNIRYCNDLQAFVTSDVRFSKNELPLKLLTVLLLNVL